MHRNLPCVLMLMLPLSAISGSHDTLSTGPRLGQGLVELMLEFLEVRYPGLPTHGDILYVSVHRQQLFHVRHGSLRAVYPVATAARGLDTRRGSGGTPTGMHRIHAKIGDGVPPFGILRGRRFTGEMAVSGGPSADDDDLITSRILWLDGLEPGHNKGGARDSHSRFIYIHGTADEASVGRPSSHGCIRMLNDDVIALFDEVDVNALVVVLDN